MSRQDRPDALVEGAEVRAGMGRPPQDDLLAMARMLVDNPNVAVLVVQDDRIAYANEALARLMERPVDSLAGAPYADVVAKLHPEDRGRAIERTESHFNGGLSAAFSGYRVAMSDGTVRWVESFARAIEFGGRPALQGVILDVTELRQVEARLRTSQARLLSITDSALDSIFCKDLDFRYTFVNPAMCRLLGMRREDLLGKQPSELFDEDSAAVVDEVDRRSASGENVSAVRALLLGDREHTFHTIQVPQRDEGGQVIGVAGIVRDVTREVEAQRALAESQERYRQLVECSPLGILVHVQGRTVLANPEAVRLLGGETEANVLGKVIWDHIAPEYHALVRDRVAEVYDRKARPPTIELEFLRLDGTRFRVEVTAGPVEHHGQSASQVVFQDITAQYEARKAKEELERQLVQAQKMEAVGRLAGGVAHDFNNLLTEISGNTALALMEIEGDNPAAPYFSAINDAARRAAALTRQLLTFSRRQVTQRTQVSLDALVGEMEKMLRRVIGADILFESRLNTRGAYVLADAGQVEQVLLNLVINARDAMPQGGRLSLRTEVVVLGEEKSRQRPDVEPGQFVVLSVADTGHGMDSETRTRVFEPFFTTKPMDKGTGLGLATAYGIVRDHGGFFEVDSEPASGTTFRVYLPVSHAPSGAASRPAAAPSLPTGDERILYVEDDDAVREITSTLLRRLGYTVIEAASPSAALLRIETDATDAVLLITDVVLPEMNGRELAKAIQRRRPGMPTLYISGHVEDGTSLRELLDPGVAFLGKPFSPQALAVKVRECLDRGYGGSGKKSG
jgi:two-component system cell cycle sensor histidine kinase/response regulator CckA